MGVHASDAIHVSARVSDRPGMLSPYQKLYGKAPFPRLLPFLKPGFYHATRTLKSESKAQVCFFLNIGSNHPRDCCKVLLVSGRRSYTRDVTWEHPREAFAGLLPAAWAKDTPSSGPSLQEAQMPPEDGEVWHELAPVPSRTSPGLAKPSPVTSQPSPAPSPVPSRPSPVPSRASPVPSQPSPVPSRASQELVQPSPVRTSRASAGATQPSPVVPSRASPRPAQPSLVMSRASPGLAQPPQSQSLPLSHQFSGAGDGGEPQKLGRTRAQTARNQAGIDRSQTANDGVAQLGRTGGKPRAIREVCDMDCYL